MLLTVQIEPYSGIFPNIIYANSSIINKLGLPLYRPFNLSFGNKKTEVILAHQSNKGNLIRVTSPIAKLLHLPSEVHLHAKYNENSGLIFGPILGILVQSIQSNQAKSPFGGLTNFAYELLKKSRNNGVLSYFFTLDKINQQTGTVSGWTLINEKWEKNTFPIPNVIYNRISSRGLEKNLLPKIKLLQEEYNFIFFNSNFLNKWEVYQLLNNTSIKTIMPETVLYKGSKTIRYMLNKSPVIYLKPTNGSLGQGIIKVCKKTDSYTIQSSSVQGNSVKNFVNYNNMYKYLIPRISSRPYIIQTGLKLISYQNRPIDFRILVQKNSTGIWAVTSMVARIAKDQYIVSNIAQGGTQGNVINTINLASPILAKKIKKTHFRKYALSIAKQLELKTPGNFAELGIDLALDDNGKLWLLEVNSKPSKNDEQKLSNEPRPSVKRLVQYVLFITKNNLQGRENL
ncbi:MAG: YheC/YheD family protein [Vulcanibacillus sp.]